MQKYEKLIPNTISVYSPEKKIYQLTLHFYYLLLHLGLWRCQQNSPCFLPPPMIEINHGMVKGIKKKTLKVCMELESMNECTLKWKHDCNLW